MITTERTIPIAAITPNPDQPRKHFDADALTELAESIRQYGLLQPLVVRPFAEGFQIIAGERRYRAALLLSHSPSGLDSLPCRVIEGIDDEEAFILSTTENVARRDMTPVEEANAYQRIRNLGRSLDDVAHLFGKTPQTIANRLDLLRLREEIQHLVARGQISIGLGWHLSRLSASGQSEVIGRFNAGSFLNDEQTIRFIDALHKQENQPAMFDAIESAFDQQRIKVHRDAIAKSWDQVAKMAHALTTLTDMTPIDLAAALQGDTAAFLTRLDLLAKQIANARTNVADAVANYQSWVDGGAA